MIGNNGINGAIKQGIEKVRGLGDAVAADAAAVFGEAAEAAATAVATASDAAETVAATVAAAAGEGDAENQRIAVLVDSATDVPPEVVEKYGVFIAPLHVNYSDGDFLDRVTIQPEEVYRRFETEIPKTSTPAPADIMALFDRIAAEGYTHVIAVTISSGLSGTYDLVRSIASGRADLQCAVIDTKSIGIAAGLTAVLVCELVDSGMPFSQVVARAEGTAERSEGFFCVNTLEYLYKGGRIGAATYAIGSKLDIRPTIKCNEEGKYVVCAKSHGRKGSLKKTVSLAKKVAAAALEEGRSVRFAVAHGDAEAEARVIADDLKAEFPQAIDVIFCQISPALVVHTGPGLVGVGVSVL